MDGGPEEDLEQTVNAQPAVLSVSVALWERSGLKEPAASWGTALANIPRWLPQAALQVGRPLSL